MTRSPRSIGELAFPEISGKLKASSILCLPIGAIEQHGAHLPLNTDVVVAEEVTQALIARWGDQLDLWRLPTLSVSLSREHDWAPGTLSLSVQTFAALLKELAREIVRALPARNLAIVNGHGGNRGILENLLHELRGDFALNACVIHPFDLAQATTAAAAADVHGGADETSVMLALAPDLVRRDLIASAPPSAPESVAALIFDRGVTWPWRTDDPRLARMGIIGDPGAASAERGRAMVERMVEAARGVFARLLENQSVMGKGR
ncbi:MAG TPA: creatininase family protein [Xanthobacteraceae bacterium]|nr:creatininase family protein [Xanthobacteraceae bacterium]